jgi:UbiD family decarboxylase
MTFRQYLIDLETQQTLLRITAPVSKTYEVAGLLKKVEPTPVLFDNLRESIYRLAGNLFCSKAAFASYFGVSVSALIPLLSEAIDEQSPCPIMTDACQERGELEPDWTRLFPSTAAMAAITSAG